jgi:hypothetical protein
VISILPYDTNTLVPQKIAEAASVFNAVNSSGSGSGGVVASRGGATSPSLPPWEVFKTLMNETAEELRKNQDAVIVPTKKLRLG